MARDRRSGAVSISAARRKVAEALAAVGILDLANRPIGALSGGQFQRVLFARLLLQDCRLILLDEPFRAVDARPSPICSLLIRRWHDEGRTVIAVLHDIEQVRAHFAKTLLLAREVVAWGERAKVLDAENLAKARHAVEAWDEHARDLRAPRRGQASASRLMIDALIAALRRVRLHAPGAGRPARAVARRARRSACS